MKLLSPVISKNIRIETELDNRLAQVHGDANQIEQAIMNLCINASEAIESNGSITVRTWNLTDNYTSFVKNLGLKHENYVVVQIEDSGVGMDAKVINHAFEPFYTTKGPGQGTGLGLSMAYGTMQNHGGAIDIQSQVNQGTKVTIVLPALASRHQLSLTPSRIVIPLKQGSILLVDDEPLILSSNKRLLARLGYDVLVADSGAKAVEIYQNSKNKIILAIVDFIMPEMDGTQTLNALREIDPDVKVVISSGYSKDGKIENALKAGAVGFIQKPFEIEQISKLLTELSPN